MAAMTLLARANSPWLDACSVCVCAGQLKGGFKDSCAAAVQGRHVSCMPQLVLS